MAAPTLILASSSPRRHEILARMTSSFSTEPADIDETPRPGEVADDYVVRLAREKAAAVARADTVVIGSDTAVVLDGTILGKPRDDEHAAEMLTALAGRTHLVVSGVAVVATAEDGAARIAAGRETTAVTMTEISPDRLAWYLACGEGRDKAGAYGLQGSGGLLVERVDGCVSNVIGLPMYRLDALCRELDVDLVALTG